MTKLNAIKALCRAMLAIAACFVLAACGSDGGTTVAVNSLPTGFLTSQAPLVRTLAGGTITPILTVGDFPTETQTPVETSTFAPIPDGLGIFEPGDGTVVVFANHELNAENQSFGSPGVDTDVEGVQAFVGSRVSRTVLNPETKGVLDITYPVDGSENYARLCSGTYANAAEGLPGGWWLAGEEAVPSPNGDLTIAVRNDGGQVIELPCLGAFSHENAIAVPYSGQVVIIGTDDAFPPGEDSFSELYMFVSDSESELLSCQGTLYVLATPAAQVSGNLTEGQTVTAQWIEVPDGIAPIEGALQDFADQVGALSFVRLEDADYDRRPGFGPAFFVADTADADVTGNSRIGATCNDGFCDIAGSLYRVNLNTSSPTGDGTLTLVSRSPGPASYWASPDNIAVNANSIMIQEDPNSRVGFTRPGGIWNCPLEGEGIGNCTEVVRLTDEGGETSGIISTEDIFGSGTWLFAVQAHDVPQPLLGLAEENGQLILLEQPGT